MNARDDNNDGKGPVRIVILGGGFGGLYTARELQRIWKRHRSRVQITLISRDNYFLMTPLLFEAGACVLEPRHAVSPIRLMLRSPDVHFVQADIRSIDFDRRAVHVRLESNEEQDVGYDHVVIALGGITNTSFIPGAADHATTYKTLGDAIYLR